MHAVDAQVGIQSLHSRQALANIAFCEPCAAHALPLSNSSSRAWPDNHGLLHSYVSSKPWIGHFLTEHDRSVLSYASDLSTAAQVGSSDSTTTSLPAVPSPVGSTTSGRLLRSSRSSTVLTTFRRSNLDAPTSDGDKLLMAPNSWPQTRIFQALSDVSRFSRNKPLCASFVLLFLFVLLVVGATPSRIRRRKAPR